MLSMKPLKRLPIGGGLALLLTFSSQAARAQMNMGSDPNMEGMGSEPAKDAPPKMKMKMPAAKPAPAKPSPAPEPQPTPAQAMPMPAPAAPAQTQSMPGMETPAKTAMEGMDEPAPSSLNGAWLLGFFGLLNAGIIAAAALLKFRRTAREVKA
jgi:hypothetical protein